MSKQTNKEEIREWEKEFREYFDKTLKPKNRTIEGLDRELIVNFIKNIEDKAQANLKAKVMETEKAFGGCHYCYGKGYGTQTAYMHGRGEADMGNSDVVIDKKLPTIKFCTCERGKQLKKLIK